MNRREDCKLDYQERVTVIWIEKVKSMGPCALYCGEGGRGSAEERCQGHSSLDAPSELNPPQRIPSPLLPHY